MKKIWIAIFKKYFSDLLDQFLHFLTRNKKVFCLALSRKFTKISTLRREPWDGPEALKSD